MFTPEERAVYKCPHTQRAYDPLAVKRVLTAGSYSPSMPRDALIALARKALGLPAIDPATGEGVLEATVWDSLCAFTVYLRGKGPRAKPMPQASPCSDGRGNQATTPTSP